MVAVIYRSGNDGVGGGGVSMCVKCLDSSPAPGISTYVDISRP